MDNNAKPLYVVRKRQKAKANETNGNGYENTCDKQSEEQQREGNLTKRKQVHDTSTRKGCSRLKRNRNKAKQINDAISDSESFDINVLRHLAVTTGGLLCSSLRRKVWPILIGVDTKKTYTKPTLADIESHKDYQQVYIDVIRCLRRFPPDVDYDERMALQDQLTSLIIRIFMKHPELHYYQGYHDICVTFLIEVGEELAFAIMDKLSVTTLKKFMERTMDSTVEVLNCICPLIGKYSPKLLAQLESSGIDTIFCLSWVITWFGHVLEKHSEVVRLYDVFLASDPLMPVYLAAALVLHRESEVLELEQDMATIHHFLSNLPGDLPLESLVRRAVQLCDEYPANRLMADIQPTGRSFKMLLKSKIINKNGSKVSDKFNNNVRRFSFDSVWFTVALAASVGAITFGIHYIVMTNTVSVPSFIP